MPGVSRRIIAQKRAENSMETLCQFHVVGPDGRYISRTAISHPVRCYGLLIHHAIKIRRKIDEEETHEEVALQRHARGDGNGTRTAWSEPRTGRHVFEPLVARQLRLHDHRPTRAGTGSLDTPR